MITFGRILIILTAFAIVMGMTYFSVSASGSSSSSAPTFERASDSFAPNAARPEFQGGDRGGGSILGFMKNIVIVAVIVAIIVLPKNLLQQKRRAVPVRIK